MTIIISAAGFIGRAAGRLLTSALGWASSLLFGRVPQSHQVYVSLMMAGSFLWVLMVVVTLSPGVAAFLLDSTPHPGFIGLSLVRFVVLTGLLFLPVGVGVAGLLAPAPEDRPTGLAAVRQILTGYPLAILVSGILVFLAGVGVARKVRNWRCHWGETHIPIVVKPGGYEKLVTDLQAGLAEAGMPVTQHDAPRVLSVPGQLLAKVAGGNVRGLVPDRLVHLVGPEIEIGLYPSDIAISGARKVRLKARAIVLSRILWTSAHLTTSAEAQAIEDQLEELEPPTQAAPQTLVSAAPAHTREKLAAIDRTLLDADLPTDEWDILYRLRLQVERDALAAMSRATRASRAELVRTGAPRPPQVEPATIPG